MIRLYLVRHGETTANLEGIIQGHLDAPLTELGVKQAHAVAKRLANEKFAAAYASDSGRAAATAEIVAAGHSLPVETTSLLREAHFGQAQGWTAAEFAEQFPDEYARWRSDSSTYRAPGGETVESMVSRCGEFIRQLEDKHGEGEHALVVAHNGSVKALIIAALGLPIRMFSRLHSANASLSVLDIGQRPSLWMFNDTCHLDSLKTFAPDVEDPIGG